MTEVKFMFRAFVDGDKVSVAKYALAKITKSFAYVTASAFEAMSDEQKVQLEGWSVIRQADGSDFRSAHKAAANQGLEPTEKQAIFALLRNLNEQRKELRNELKSIDTQRALVRDTRKAMLEEIVAANPNAN